MGLIQRVIEESGIPTISLSIVREYTEAVKPPRTLFLRWPFGHPLGEPGNINQQAAVLNKAFEALLQIDTPGQIIDVGWRWRRESYPPAPWLSDSSACRITSAETSLVVSDRGTTTGSNQKQKREFYELLYGATLPTVL